MTAPTVTETILRQHLDAWLSNKNAHSRTLLLRAQPRWSGEPVITVRGTRVRVVEGVSGLAALDAMRSAAADESVVVLTALNERDLGDAVVLDAHRQRVSNLDEWSVVPGLFGVRDQNVPRQVLDLGRWLPSLLVSLRPSRGYQPAPGAVLTADHVARSLVAAALGLSRLEDLDLMAFLTPLDDAAIRGRLRTLGADERTGLIHAASDYVGPHMGIALRAAVNGGSVSVLAIGLVVAELWGHGTVPSDAAAAAARVRLEPYVGSRISAQAAARYGEAVRKTVKRLFADGQGHDVLEQAAALCVEIDWQQGASASNFLLAGLDARINDLATSIEEAANAPSADAAAGVEDAFRRVWKHLAAQTISSSLSTAAMAVRLVRWLIGSEHTPASFNDSAQQYATDGAWAERALGDIWDGGSHPVLARAFGVLAQEVQRKLRAQDSVSAALLSGAPIVGNQVIGVEDLLREVIVPLSADQRVLLIVLDGMSFAVATELAAEVPEYGWSEIVRAQSMRRGAIIAALPTMTEFSRTSLLCGELRAGDQQVEKARFAKTVGGVVFHKDDLRSDAGHALPAPVTAAMSNPGQKIVGVVLNTIDDALATAEVDSLRWHVSQIANLKALLDAARDANRIVVLTSDHGHIAERGSELRSAPGASARYRDVSTGEPRTDEVHVTGPRVLTAGGSSILAVSDGARFAAKKAGYHGGASLAETVIPLVVMMPKGAASPSGWVEAPPQEPVWWNEPVRRAEPASALPKASKSRNRVAEVAGPTLFDELPTDQLESEASIPLEEELVASDVYRARRRSGGRHPIEDETVRTIIATLAAGGWRAHRDTLAVAAGIPATSVSGVLASLRRLLNVDGYAVVDLDADRQTVVLDSTLLREQFHLGAQR